MNKRHAPHSVTDAELDRALYSLRERARLSQGESAQMRAALLSHAAHMTLPRQSGRARRLIARLFALFAVCSDTRVSATRPQRISVSVPHHFHIDRYSSHWLLLSAFS
jgi:hypothetical protein